MKIGDVLLPEGAALAPMAGVTDRAFREICREHGAIYTVTEMVSAKGLVYHDRKTAGLLSAAPDEHPMAAQIFGSDPASIAEAAPMAVELSGADILDINMGCPTPKITGGGDGCALMRDMDTASRVIRAAADAVKVPVTVKFRLGWDKDSINCVEFAKMAEASGAKALCIHGRTRRQMYSGDADMRWIEKAVRSVNIPVFANGDIVSGQTAIHALSETDAAGIMIGRGALGNPWIFSEINAAFDGRQQPPAPSLSEKLDVAARQIELAVKYKGEYIAMLEARKHLAWYLKGIRGTAKYRARFSTVTSRKSMYKIMDELRLEAAGRI